MIFKIVIEIEIYCSFTQVPNNEMKIEQFLLQMKIYNLDRKQVIELPDNGRTNWIIFFFTILKTQTHKKIKNKRITLVITLNFDSFQQSFFNHIFNDFYTMIYGIWVDVVFVSPSLLFDGVHFLPVTKWRFTSDRCGHQTTMFSC